MYPRTTTTHDWHDDEQALLTLQGWKYQHKSDIYKKGIVTVEKLYKKCYKVFLIGSCPPRPIIITDLKKLVW